MWTVVWKAWWPPGITEMISTCSSDRRDREAGLAQRQVGEGDQAPAGERDAREDGEVDESDDHVALLNGRSSAEGTLQQTSNRSNFVRTGDRQPGVERLSRGEPGHGGQHNE